MRWKGRRRSSNVEDRRGKSVGKGIAGVGGGLGIIILLIFTILGGDPGDLINNIGVPNEPNIPYEATQEEQELAEFVSVVLADTEDVWTEVLSEEGVRYKEPTLVLFSDRVESACGIAGSATGPFYCPGDEKVYIDLSFYDELRDRFQAPGDFAIAYVVAHEVGHHVQNLLGISSQVQSLRGKVSQEEYNKYSVRLELQADYLAGVWAHHAENLGYLEKGDLDEALNAASAIGDDRLQRQAQGYVVPESFTHGTSEQRQRWFYKGFVAGDLSEWNTFEAKDL